MSYIVAVAEFTRRNLIVAVNAASIGIVGVFG